ncbi:MAG: c-type cytochrome [Granulosicoccus sp.]
MTTRLTLKSALLGGGLILAFAANAESPSAEMLSYTCAGCHGTDGVSNGPAIPTIAGISKDFFIELMTEFRDDTLPSTVMGRIAKGYSDEEIELMSDFFSEQAFVAAKQESDAELAAAGAKLHDKYCEKCHADGGTSAEDDAGILAGQWTPYVKWSLEDFHSGMREMPKKMKKQMAKMQKKQGEEALPQLLNYYAGQQ